CEPGFGRAAARVTKVAPARSAKTSARPAVVPANLPGPGGLVDGSAHPATHRGVQASTRCGTPKELCDVLNLWAPGAAATGAAAERPVAPVVWPGSPCPNTGQRF